VEGTKAVRLSKIVNCSFTVIFILGTIWTTGCGRGEGSIRAIQEEVVGVYEAKFENGREVLELKRDQTYVQDFTSGKRSIHHTGQWKIESHFLNKSDVVLNSCVVSEDDETVTERIGDRILNVHGQSGKLTLAINEAADWYFIRIK
jgi:hypothetical protein